MQDETAFTPPQEITTQEITPGEITPGEAFQDSPTIRRLCIFRFECPLCFQEHEDQFYITMPVSDLDEFVARLRQYTSDWNTLQHLLVNTIVQFHSRKGDLMELADQAGDKPMFLAKSPTVEVTGETNYTCIHCSRTFNSNTELHSHMEQCLKTT